MAAAAQMRRAAVTTDRNRRLDEMTGSLFIADLVLPCHLHSVNCALILVLRGRTSWVSTDMDGSHRHLTAQLTDFWLARGAILVIVMLQIGIVNDLAVGPRWLAPGLELVLLIPLSLATAWMQQRARGASTDGPVSVATAEWCGGWLLF